MLNFIREVHIDGLLTYMWYSFEIISRLWNLPNKGIASLVAGIVSARTCENTVRESMIVTPEIGNCLSSNDQQL